MRHCSPDSRSSSSPDSPNRDVHLIPGPDSRDPRRHRLDAVVGSFGADCRARNLSPATVEFYLEGLTSYRHFGRDDGRALTLADLDLDIARSWLADFVERGRRPATVATRARAPRDFGRWIEAQGYARDHRTAAYAVTSPCHARPNEA